MWGNGYKQYYDYDLTGRNFKYELTNSSDVSLLGKDYYFDLNSNITTINDIINSTLNRTVNYDNIDRITSSVSNSITQSFTYDLNSNRLSKNDNGTNVTYTISSTNNRLNSVGGTSYTYDNAGNPTAIGSTTFGYNLANRLVSVNSGNLANYYHNALGQRVRKLVSSNNTYFMYSEDGKLLGEYDNSGNLIREYIYLGDKIVAVVKGTTGNELYYVIPDHLNTPRKVINSSNGNIIWSWESKPFGDDLPNEDVDNDSNLFTMPIRFPGQYYDSEVGYNYNYFRTYNSDTGRYLQSDPIGLEGGLNTYGYVSGKPLSKIDPLGLMEIFNDGSGVDSNEKYWPRPKPDLRPDGQPWGYGCGDKNTDKFVPDGLNGTSFSKPCRQHDLCYEKCPNKNQCDYDLGKNILNECIKSGNFNMSCILAGPIYWVAVHVAGGDAYNAARKK